MAAGSFGVEMFQEILKWAKENLIRQEVYKLFVAAAKVGKTVFHEVAGSDKIGKIQGIFNCTKKNLTRGEVNKLFLSTDNEGRTVFHEVAWSYKKKYFRKYCIAQKGI